MSHLKERKEKNCLNCNAVIHGRYCSVCGQENLEPQEGVTHLISHFFNDITHFDGKFFSSLKYLLFKPGFLSEEYMAGRRNSYLNPVRMYIFTSFVFFIVFFSVASGFEGVSTKPKKAGNTAVRDSITKALAANNLIDTGSSQKKEQGFLIFDAGDDWNFGEVKYRDRKQYDSLIDAGKLDHGFFRRIIERKQIELNKKYGNDAQLIGDRVLESFIHSVPQMFILSLPLLALVLKLLYIRRKKFYYVSHAIFVIYLFIFVDIDILLILGINKLQLLPYTGWLSLIKILLTIWLFYYGYRAMKVFYGQSYIKTFFKYLLVLISLIFIALLSIIVIGYWAVYKA